MTSCGDRIDGACDRFEDEWRANRRPRIEDYLDGWPEAEHAELLRQLLRVEIELRRERGETPAPGDYRGRFPAYAASVDAAFDGPAATDPHGERTRTAGRGEDEDPGGTRVEEGASAGPTAATGPRFRVLRFLARGGLGEVFVARDGELHRDVALKRIQGRYADDPNGRARFLLEAEVTGRLEHPGVVPVYGLGRDADGRPYYAMKLIRGDTLKQAVARFHQPEAPDGDPPGRAVEFRRLLARFVAVCETIAFAHDRGVIHRDIKPSNVLLGKYGETQVVDWGLAKVVGRPEGADVADEPTLRPGRAEGSETVTGSALGTPAYMSPEQAAGALQQLGPASDIYSLGATLYCLLTGRAPFPEPKTDPALAAVLRQVQDGDFPPPRSVDATLDPALEAVCLKAMARQPADRYPSGLALAADLEHWLADEPVSALREPWGRRVARWTRRHRAWVRAGAAALLMVTFVSVAAVIVVDASRRREVKAADRARISDRQADERRLEAAEHRLATERQRLVAEAEHRRVQHLEAERTVNRGQAACEQGEVGFGMSWLARGLVPAAGAEADLLQHTIRVSLAAWRPHMVTLRWGHAQGGLCGAVAFSPDGKTVVAGTTAGTLRSWDVATGRTSGPKFEDPGPTDAVAFSPDGKWILAGCSDHHARLYEAATGKLLKKFPHPYNVKAVAFSRDGDTFVTGIGDETRKRGEAWLWKVSTGQRFGEPLRHENAACAAAFSPDGTLVATGGLDNVLRLWDAATGEPVRAIPDKGPVLAVAFGPDGRKLLTGLGNSAQLWELLGPSDPAGHIDGATVGPPSSRTLWTIPRKSIPVRTMNHGGAWVKAVAFSPDGKALLTGTWESMVYLWDATSCQPLTAPLLLPDRVHAVAFSPDGKSFATGSGIWGGHPPGTPGRGETRLWGMPDENLFRTLDYGGAISDVAFSPDGKTVLTAGWSHPDARLWEMATGKAVGVPLLHGDQLLAVAFSRDDKTALTGSKDRAIRRWDAATGLPLGQLLRLPDPVTAVAFSPDRTKVATGHLKHARVWGLETGRPVGEPMPSGGAEIMSLAFSTDGRRLLTGGANTEARLWDAATGRPLIPPLVQKGRVWNVVFSPDGTTFATASGREVRFWDAATGRTRGIPLAHPDPVYTVAFSPDGTIVMTGSGDGEENTRGEARLWDAATGRPLGRPLRNTNHVHEVAFSPDGKTFLTGSEATQRSLRLWPMIVEGSAERINTWVQVLTGLEIDPGGAVSVLDVPTWQRRRERLDDLGGPPLP